MEERIRTKSGSGESQKKIANYCTFNCVMLPGEHILKRHYVQTESEIKDMSSMQWIDTHSQTSRYIDKQTEG